MKLANPAVRKGNLPSLRAPRNCIPLTQQRLSHLERSDSIRGNNFPQLNEADPAKGGPSLGEFKILNLEKSLKVPAFHVKPFLRGTAIHVNTSWESRIRSATNPPISMDSDN